MNGERMKPVWTPLNELHDQPVQPPKVQWWRFVGWAILIPFLYLLTQAYWSQNRPEVKRAAAACGMTAKEVTDSASRMETAFNQNGIKTSESDAAVYVDAVSQINRSKGKLSCPVLFTIYSGLRVNQHLSHADALVSVTLGLNSTHEF